MWGSFMVPDETLDPYHVKYMKGASFRLFLALWRMRGRETGDSRCGLIRDGQIIQTSEILSSLGLREATYRSQLRTLKEGGYVVTLRAGQSGFRGGICIWSGHLGKNGSRANELLTMLKKLTSTKERTFCDMRTTNRSVQCQGNEQGKKLEPVRCSDIVQRERNTTGKRIVRCSDIVQNSPFLDLPNKEEDRLRDNKTESSSAKRNVEVSARPTRPLHKVQNTNLSGPAAKENRMVCFQSHLNEIEPGIRPRMGGKFKSFAGQLSPYDQGEIFRGVLRDISENRSKMASGEIRNPIGWVTWRIEQWCRPRIVQKDLPLGVVSIETVFQGLCRID